MSDRRPRYDAADQARNAQNPKSLSRIAVLISGNGSNLQAMIDQPPGQIVGVLSNRPHAYGLTRANQAHIPAAVVDHRAFATREAFDTALDAELQAWQADYVILAGFMRVLTAAFVERWAGRMLNIHPSLLPKYRGLHTHARALAAGDTHHGSTVHFVTSELDGGPAVLQAQVAILPGDSADALADRVQVREHEIYPRVAAWLCQGRLRLADGRPELDGAVLDSPVVLAPDQDCPL